MELKYVHVVVFSFTLPVLHFLMRRVHVIHLKPRGVPKRFSTLCNAYNTSY